MSFSGLFAIGLSGVNAFAAGLEAVSNNIANSQTVGFKRARTDFSDLVTTGRPDAGGKIGTGVAASNRPLIAEQGTLARTGSATDIAIAGQGFFVVSDPAESGAGSMLFTRSGDFTANVSGLLRNGAGYQLMGLPLGPDGAAPQAPSLSSLEPVDINRTPPVADGQPAPGELLSVEIDAAGRVIASYATGEKIALYQLPLALFTNAAALAETRGTAYAATSESGAATLANPQNGRAGAVEGSALEFSTVDIGQEFSTLISTQRAYASSARILSAADEMWRALAGVGA